MSSDESINPKMYNWNKIFVAYCDGASFSGSNTRAVTVPSFNGEVYFSGRFILTALYETLLSKFHMDEASDVIVSGSSAGGLTVFLHIDYIAELIKKRSWKYPRIVG